MKIGNPASGIPELAPAATGRSAPETAAPASAGTVAAAGSAQVELSSTAASLLSGVKGAPAEFDADKVARISQAIADGSFKVNPDAIADKLIANAQEVLASVKPAADR